MQYQNSGQKIQPVEDQTNIVACAAHNGMHSRWAFLVVENREKDIDTEDSGFARSFDQPMRLTRGTASP